MNWNLIDSFWFKFLQKVLVQMKYQKQWQSFPVSFCLFLMLVCVCERESSIDTKATKKFCKCGFMAEMQAKVTFFVIFKRN